MAMQSQAIASSAISSLQYDDETQEMVIVFKDGRGYTVPNVPEIEVYRLANSSSPGGYWNANMRGKY
jgi:hypothetical protein